MNRQIRLLTSVLKRTRVLTPATGMQSMAFSSTAVAGQRKVELFYDVLSPYSWIGMELMLRANKQWNVELSLRPSYFFGIVSTSKNVAPGQVPTKFAYLGRDVMRLGKYYNIPIRGPADPTTTFIKKGSINAQRFLTALEATHPECLADVSRQLWLRIWSTDKDIADAKSLMEAARAAGCDDSVVRNAAEKMKDEQIKARLAATTQEAVDNGAFGVPTFVVHGADGKKKMFFGSDRFHLIAQALGEKDPAPLFVDSSSAKL